jgi:hypothetical protein
LAFNLPQRFSPSPLPINFVQLHIPVLYLSKFPVQTFSGFRETYRAIRPPDRKLPHRGLLYIPPFHPSPIAYSQPWVGKYLTAAEAQVHISTEMIETGRSCLTRGAGNIFSSESHTTPRDLVTPTIKQDVYTTGRGGQGNMVVNDPQHPEIARESQDVEAPPLRVEEAPHHTGRGMFVDTRKMMFRSCWIAC